MFWDDLMRRWRREHGTLDPPLLLAASGNVAVLPGPRPRRRSRARWLVLLAIGAAAALLLLNGEVEAFPVSLTA